MTSKNSSQRTRYTRKGKSLVALMAYSLKIFDALSDRYKDNGHSTISAEDRDLSKLFWLRAEVLTLAEKESADASERKSAKEYVEAIDRWSVNVFGVDVPTLEKRMWEAVTDALERSNTGKAKVSLGSPEVHALEGIQLPTFDEDVEADRASPTVTATPYKVDPWSQIRD
jgi:hypothetical protein